MARLVRDLMHPGVITCSPEIKLGKVAQLLAKNHIHALFVVDDQGEPIGVITDYDVMAGEWLSGDPESLAVMREMTAGELMSSPVETVEADCSVDEAAERMRKDQIRRLLVMDGNRAVGVISVSDFIAELATRAPARRETVGDVMSDAFLVCRERTPVVQAAKAMAETGWRSVVVVDGRGKPLGIFSGLDLLTCCDSRNNVEDILVTDVMHKPLKIGINASLQEAAQLMIDEHHHRILVVDLDDEDSLPLGVISSFDIVNEMAKPDSVWQT